MPSHANQASASISATTTSARTAYPVLGNGVAVYNSGSVVVFVASGDSTVTATTSGQFVAPGETVEFKHNPADTHLAAITASSTATVYFTDASIIL